jgi:hypothetical protein
MVPLRLLALHLEVVMYLLGIIAIIFILGINIYRHKPNSILGSNNYVWDTCH